MRALSAAILALTLSTNSYAIDNVENQEDLEFHPALPVIVAPPAAPAPAPSWFSYLWGKFSEFADDMFEAQHGMRIDEIFS